MNPLTRVCCSGILFSFFTSVTFADHRIDFSQLKYYSGVDLQQRTVEFKKDYGHGLFVNRIPQLNLYFGAKINDYFGAEVGYEASNAETKNNTLFYGEKLLGVLLDDPADVFAVKEQVRMRGAHFNVLIFAPVTNRTQLIGSIGISSLIVKLKHTQLGNEAGVFTPAAVANSERKFSSRRIIPRFSGGFQHEFSKRYGIRGTVGYEETGKFKNLFPKNRENSPFRASLKNSVIYSAGGFFYF